MRWARSVASPTANGQLNRNRSESTPWTTPGAWSSRAGLYGRSKWITWFAAVKVRPTPPTCDEVRDEDRSRVTGPGHVLGLSLDQGPTNMQRFNFRPHWSLQSHAFSMRIRFEQS